MSTLDKLDTFEWSNQGKRLPSELFVIIRNYILNDYDELEAGNWAYEYLNKSLREKAPSEESRSFLYDATKHDMSIDDMLDKYLKDIRQSPNDDILKLKIQYWIDIIGKYIVSDISYVNADEDVAWSKFLELMYESETYNENLISLISIMINNQTYDIKMHNYNPFMSIDNYMKLTSQLHTILKRVNKLRIILMYTPEHIIYQPPYSDFFLEDLYTMYELILKGDSSEINDEFVKQYNDYIDKYNKDIIQFSQLGMDIFTAYTGPHTALPPKIE